MGTSMFLIIITNQRKKTLMISCLYQITHQVIYMVDYSHKQRLGKVR